MATVALNDLCQAIPLVDAYALSDTQCLLLLSQAADPALVERQSALVVVDRILSEASLIAEFPGASELVLWIRPAGTQGLDFHALVASPGGHLWELVPGGQVKPIYDAFGDDGPARYGYLNCCVAQAGFVYVGGMCNQLYRSLTSHVRFERLDELLLDREMLESDSAIYGLADLGGTHLVGVGGGGLVFWIEAGVPRLIDSGTNAMINAVSAIDSETFVACAAGGIVLQGSTRGWCRAEDSGLSGVYFSDVRNQGQRHLWIGGQRLHVSSFGARWNSLSRVVDAPSVSRFARGGASTWAVGSKCLGWTRDAHQWTWLPTASIPVTTASTGSAGRS